jgi:hypothetical protein
MVDIDLMGFSNDSLIIGLTADADKTTGFADT